MKTAISPRKAVELIAVALVAALALCLPTAAFAAQDLVAGSPQTVSPAASTPNLTAAMKAYGVPEDRAISIDNVNDIETALGTYATIATAKKPYIVYVRAGNYVMPKKLTIPANVILVAEKSTKFTPKTASNFTQFFTVAGAVYGGTYDGAGKAYYCLRFENTSFNGVNGTIQKAFVSNAKKYGIVAIGAKTKNANVIGCSVSSCGTSGISAVQGAHMATVNKNTVTKCRESGVNLGHANIDVISNNKLTNNKGHGISTDIDGSGGHKYCYINTVSGNTITGNGVNGVYIDKKCHIAKLFSKNTVSKNGLCGLSIDAGGYVKGIANNTLSANKRANLNVTGKGATAYLGSKNALSNAGTNNVNIDAFAKVQLAGSNNSFNKAKNVGISLNGKSSFVVKSGKKNQVKKNKGFGIRVEGKSSCTISDMVFGGNGGFAVKVYKGSKISQKGCGLSTDTKAKNRLYIV